MKLLQLSCSPKRRPASVTFLPLTSPGGFTYNLSLQMWPPNITGANITRGDRKEGEEDV